MALLLIPNNPFTKVLLLISMTLTFDSLEVLVLTWGMLPLIYIKIVPLTWKTPAPSHLGILIPLKQNVKDTTLLVGMIDSSYPGEIESLIYDEDKK